MNASISQLPIIAAQARNRLTHRQSLLLAIALAVAAVVASILHARPLLIGALNIYDEGIILTGAARVMRGELPYRDFWTQYSPGQFYTLAALFSITGKSVLAARWWDVVTRALLAVALYLLAARATNPMRALPVWPLAVLWLTYYGFFSYPLFQGLLFSLLCLLVYLRGLESARWMPLAGGLFGMAFVFRHDMAIYLAATVVLTGAAHAWVRSTRPSDLARQLAPMVIVAALIVLPVTLYFLVQVRPAELLNQLFLFPLLEFPKVRDLPYPKLTGEVDNLPFYAPFLIYGLVFVSALVRLRRLSLSNMPATADAGARIRALAMLAMAVFGAFGYNQARVRSDLIHTVHFFTLALALAPALFSAGAAGATSAYRRVGGHFVGMLGMTLMLMLCIDPLDNYVGQMQAQSNDARYLAAKIKAAPPIAQGIAVEDWQTGLLTVMKFYAEPEDSVYIGLKRHDRVFANDVMSYFLIDRPAPTRYHEIHPGVVDTLAVQQEMIADLERTKPRLVFLTDIFDGASEPNESNKSKGVKVLDEYIRQHYRVFTISGPYSVMRRKEAK